MPNLQEYLMVKQAAAYVGVVPNTLRNWGRVGKIKERRNPLNGYRLCTRSELDRIRQRIERAATSHRKPR